MNINVKDGLVLSFGSSFYSGTAPTFFEDVGAEQVTYPHSDYCEKLGDELDSWPIQSDQVVFGGHRHSSLDELKHVYQSNCQFHGLPDELSGKQFISANDPADFRPALLQFMISATPREELAEDIQANFEKHMNSMRITDTSHFAPAGNHIQFTADNVPDAVSPVKARLAYIQVPTKDKTSTTLKLVWKFEVEMKDNWYEAAVSANAPHRIVSVVDWASDSPIPPPSHPPASYNIFPWGINDPACGNRTIVSENDDKIASPVGWHVLPFANDPTYHGSGVNHKDFFRNTTSTWGNNVFAQENWEGRNNFVRNGRPSVDGKGMQFDYMYDPQDGPEVDPMSEAQAYINATVTQLFYTSNMVHDFYYRYGFDEVSGNFQQYNFGRGGQENDAVIANAQDGSGFNNANFMTPPDGSNGRMRMYLWNTARPYRDGDLEAGIVIHELSHGLSTRLTGGPANSGCLGWGESGGMGEGWGDFLATMIRSHEGETEHPMGAWASNKKTGIRNYIYSIDNKVNPSLYKTLDNPGYWGVHAIGEVWAEILWIVAQDLIKVHGYSETLYPPLPLDDGSIPDGDFFRPGTPGRPKVPKNGNSLIVQLVISAMKLQPCRPSFFNARDAIIQADEILTGGENFCTIWKGFAKRGLGVDAKIEGQTPWGGGRRTNGFAVPSAC
jgi:extracellular elastinolytic metalloproteinase